jgi:trans-aconitate 2-methyltransferase
MLHLPRHHIQLNVRDPTHMSQWNPADYSAHSTVQQAWARELIGRLRLQPHEHVLDIGCGDGKVTAEIAGLLPGGRVVGIDSSAEMIRFARLEFPVVRCPNLRLEVMDARDLRFDAEFDAVFSNAALHWINRDHRAVLAGIARALRPGGRVLLQMGGRGNAADVLEVLEQILPAEPWRNFFPEGMDFPYGFFSPEEYEPWLFEAGLIVKRVELIPKDMVHANREALAGWIRTTWLPYTEHVPADLRAAFIQEVVDRYLAHHPADAAGNIHLRMVRLEVDATR